MVLRKLAVALLSVGVMLPGLGHALAVRDLQTKSALGEPFQGEIELVEVGDLNADEIKVSLATQEDFERLGVERVYFLTDLRFDVVVNAAGRSFVKITSIKPVREPFLDFVVRIAWPGNARLQGVTALLDPPVVADVSPQDVQRAVTTTQFMEPEPVATEPEPVAETTTEPPAPVLPPVPDAQVAAQPTPERQPQPEQPEAKQPEQPQPVPQPDSYRTRSGDTMWKVAEQLRPATSVSVSQTMIAIQRANPKAFAGDNINQLKRGQVLRIPSESQIREVSAQEAAASIREQNQEWRSTQTAAPAVKPALDAQQVNATAPEVVAKPVVAAPKPEVKLLAAETSKAGASSAGKDQGAVKPAEAKKLDENRVKAEAAKAEKAKLAAKVGALDSQVKANDKQLEVQNAKLAELQSKLKEQQAKAAAAAAAKPVAPVVTKPVAPEVTKPAPVVTATPEELDALTSPDAKSTQAATTPAEVAPPVAAAPLPAPVKPVVVEEPVAEEGVNPLLIGGGLVALLGGLAGFLWNKRRREKAEEEEALAELEGMDERLAEIGGGAALPDSFAFGGAHQEEESDFAGLQAAVVQDRTKSDPLEEVEQYLAFERYPQAAGFLVKAVDANPQRADLRMKLLEVYAHLNDHEGFAKHQAWFEEAGDFDSLARAEELKSTMTTSAGSARGNEDFASLEDLEMDFNASVSASSPSLPAVSDKDLDSGFDLDASFDMDADFGLSTPAEKPAAASDSGLSLDEDLDFSFDKKAEPAPSVDHADELSFELDDSAFASKPAASALDVAADEGMDFSLDDVTLDEVSLEEEPKAAASTSMSLGDIELADFDMEEPVIQQPAPAVAKPVVDDLSFSLDDLEMAEPVAATTSDEGLDLEGDFNLDESVVDSGDFSFDADAKADSGMKDAVADFDAELSLDTLPEQPAVAPAKSFAAPMADDLGMDDEFDFLADTDENATKLDLARAYIDMGDMEGARDILQEVLNEGNGTQKDEAKSLLSQVG